MEMEEARKSPRVRVVNRRQLLMRTIDVESLIEEDHPARAIWEFTARLDLSSYYDEIEAVEGVAGRSALDPRMMMSVWIYAYSEGVGSAREIARLSCEPERTEMTGEFGVRFTGKALGTTGDDELFLAFI